MCPWHGCGPLGSAAGVARVPFCKLLSAPALDPFQGGRARGRGLGGPLWEVCRQCAALGEKQRFRQRKQRFMCGSTVWGVDFV